jgi:pantetheine-phosphate adenylyltransferase
MTPAGKAVVVYPGSFDPVTNGHLDVIERAARLFDRLIVALLENPEKRPLFSLRERTRLLRDAVEGIGNVEVDSFSGLLVDYAGQREASMILRGLRAVSDFEFEFQMALMNRRLSRDIETVFMMPREDYSYVSSRLVKEVATLGGDVSALVSPAVSRALLRKVRGKSGGGA